MPESFRSAYRNLLRLLSALLAFSRSAGASLLARLRPVLAALRSAVGAWVARLPDLLETLRSAVRSLVARLPDVIETLRSDSAQLLHRLADAIAPQAPAPTAEAVDGEQEFAQMLADLGAETPPLEQRVDSTLKDTTIRALSDNLHGLRDLGDQLARAEQDKLALAARLTELEAELGGDPHGEDGDVARLARVLEEHEGALERTREQLARQRAKTGDWKRKAAERWHEIGSLRSRVKELERVLAETHDGGQAGPLPKRSASGARRERRAGRRGA